MIHGFIARGGVLMAGSGSGLTGEVARLMEAESGFEHWASSASEAADTIRLSATWGQFTAVQGSGGRGFEVNWRRQRQLCEWRLRRRTRARPGSTDRASSSALIRRRCETWFNRRRVSGILSRSSSGNVLRSTVRCLGCTTCQADGADGEDEVKRDWWWRPEG